MKQPVISIISTNFHNSVISASQVTCASVCANLKQKTKKHISERKQSGNELKEQKKRELESQWRLRSQTATEEPGGLFLLCVSCQSVDIHHS